MQEHIQYDFLADGHFAELKDSELLNERINNLGSVESYINTFFSKEYVMKKVLRMTDNEIDEMQRQIKREEVLTQMRVVLMFQTVQMVSQDIHQLTVLHYQQMMLQN